MGKNRFGKHLGTKALTAAICLALSASTAFAMPTGGTIAQGTVSGLTGGTVASGGTLTPNGASIINWEAFSIGKGETLSVNTANGALLNRVTGKDISTLAGVLKQTGKNPLLLVNPNGITVMGTAEINTANLILSTLSVTDDDFLSFATGKGNLNFAEDIQKDDNGLEVQGKGITVETGAKINVNDLLIMAGGSVDVADGVTFEATPGSNITLEAGRAISHDKDSNLVSLEALSQTKLTNKKTKEVTRNAIENDVNIGKAEIKAADADVALIGASTTLTESTVSAKNLSMVSASKLDMKNNTLSAYSSCQSSIKKSNVTINGGSLLLAGGATASTNIYDYNTKTSTGHSNITLSGKAPAYFLGGKEMKFTLDGNGFVSSADISDTTTGYGSKIYNTTISGDVGRIIIAGGSSLLQNSDISTKGNDVYMAAGNNLSISNDPAVPVLATTASYGDKKITYNWLTVKDSTIGTADAPAGSVVLQGGTVQVGGSISADNVIAAAGNTAANHNGTVQVGSTTNNTVNIGIPETPASGKKAAVPAVSATITVGNSAIIAGGKIDVSNNSTVQGSQSARLVAKTGADLRFTDTSDLSKTTLSAYGHTDDMTTNVDSTSKAAWTDTKSSAEAGPAITDVTKPDTGKKDDTTKPDTGKKDDTTKPDTGKKDDTTKPDTGKKDDTTKPDTGKKDDTTKPDTGKKDDTTKPDTGKKDDTKKPDTGKKDDTTTKPSGKFIPEGLNKSDKAIADKGASRTLIAFKDAKDSHARQSAIRQIVQDFNRSGLSKREQSAAVIGVMDAIDEAKAAGKLTAAEAATMKANAASDLSVTQETTEATDNTTAAKAQEQRQANTAAATTTEPKSETDPVTIE